MRDRRHEELEPTFDMDSLLSLMRIIATGLGVITIVIGLFYLTRIFAMVYEGLHAPNSFEIVFARWADAVGGRSMDLVINGNTVPCANILAIAVLGGGMLMLCWITMGVIFTGAKIVSWTAGDRDSIRRILTHAFGPTMKPANQEGSK